MGKYICCGAGEQPCTGGGSVQGFCCPPGDTCLNPFYDSFGGPNAKGFTCCPPGTTGCYGPRQIAGAPPVCCAAGDTCVTTTFGYQVAPYCGAQLAKQTSAEPLNRNACALMTAVSCLCPGKRCSGGVLWFLYPLTSLCEP